MKINVKNFQTNTEVNLICFYSKLGNDLKPTAVYFDQGTGAAYQFIAQNQTKDKTKNVNEISLKNM